MKPRGFIRSWEFAAGAASMMLLLAGGTVVGAGMAQRQSSPPANGFACTVSSVTDGDTLRCAEREPDGRAIRIRVSGIAARERDGSCSASHPCPRASAEQSTAALERLALGQRLQCTMMNRSFGRRAAFCRRSDGVDLSCAMVRSGMAARWDRHWGRHRC